MDEIQAIQIMERELGIYEEKYIKHKSNKTTLEQFYKNKLDALNIVIKLAKNKEVAE